MFKSCSKCGRIHPQGYKCNVKTAAETNEQKLRACYKWNKKSVDIRKRSNYICAVCHDLYIRFGVPINTKNRVEVHHITKLKDDPLQLLADDNLICLCTEHHKQADNGEIDADYLRELANMRDGVDI